MTETRNTTAIDHPTVDQNDAGVHMIVCRECGRVEWITDTEYHDHAHCRYAATPCWCTRSPDAEPRVAEREIRQRAAAEAFAQGWSCTPMANGCKHPSCAAARVNIARRLRSTART